MNDMSVTLFMKQLPWTRTRSQAAHLVWAASFILWRRQIWVCVGRWMLTGVNTCDVSTSKLCSGETWVISVCLLLNLFSSQRFYKILSLFLWRETSTLCPGQDAASCFGFQVILKFHPNSLHIHFSLRSLQTTQSSSSWCCFAVHVK